MRLDHDLPFVLLDDVRDGAARLYRRPVDIVRADRPDQVPGALAALRALQRSGRHLAGYLRYEAGAALLPHLPPPPEQAGPLLWFGAFDAVQMLSDEALAALLPQGEGALIGAPRPGIDRDRYDAMIAEALALIQAGDIYQVNLTFPASVPIIGDALAAYAQLRARARPGYGALIMTGAETIWSLSPELFFAIDGKAIEARPMKGTARRQPQPDADRAAARALAEDEKQRAENLMIVDLLRNDLSQVAAAGSVAVPSLFAIESYPTVHQMVSTVTAALAPDRDAIDVMSALFPCGSITGAPKIRAMQVIGDIEQEHPRGIYTGTIGAIDPAGDAVFNVAIRTLVRADPTASATMGVGSGIVADSQADAEWDECLAKAAFVATPRPPALIETMAFDPEQGIARLELHLSRMKESARALGYGFDRHAARNDLQAATFALRDRCRVRLVLSASGAIAIETGPLPTMPAEPVPVAVVPLPVAPHDFRLRYKTSDRGFYDRAREESGAFEVLFVHPNGQLTEGSFTSLFVERGGRLVTPSLALGLLPGILRQSLIDAGDAVEAAITVDDLANGFFIGNALRGLMRATLVAVRHEPGL